MAYDEVFVSVGWESYKINKSNLLRGQVDILNSLRKLNNLVILCRQKNDLKRKMQKSLSVINSEISSLHERFSNIELPREYKKETKEKERIEPSKKNSLKQDSIDAELQVINEKLRILNGM